MLLKRLFLPVIIFAVLPAFLMAGGNSETAAAGDSSAEISGSSVVVTDYTGKEVSIRQPVERVVSLNSGLSEILGALECGDKMVGRDNFSTFPSSLKYIQSVARNSSSPNMEMLLSLEPDLVVADLMFDKSKREILENRGIPVLIESTSNPDRLPLIVDNFARIFDKQERAGLVMGILNSTLSEVESKIRSLEERGIPKPLVFFENRKVYKSANSSTGHHQNIVLAGGINIAADEPVSSPRLNPEYIVEMNPDVIIRRVSGDIDADAMELMLRSIYERPSLQSVKAIQEKRVYIVKSDLFISLRYPVGVAYLSRLFYGDELSDFDVDGLFQDYITELYGPDEWKHIRETYVFPDE
jgi:iron complex transport system substrate-binding protein